MLIAATMPDVMALKFRCPGCEKKLAVADTLAGKAIRCPNCQTKVRVPTPKPKPAPEPVLEPEPVEPPRRVDEPPTPEPATEPQAERPSASERSKPDPLAATSAIPPGTLDEVLKETDPLAATSVIPPGALDEVLTESNPPTDPLAATSVIPPGALDEVLTESDPLAASSVIPPGALDDMLDEDFGDPDDLDSDFDDDASDHATDDFEPSGEPTDSDLLRSATGTEEDETAVRRRRALALSRYEEETSEDAGEPVVLSSRLQDEEDDLDMTPMVDVTFLLLIFFMITASFTITKTMPAQPPQPDSQAAAAMLEPEEAEEEPILVEIFADNSVHVEGRRVATGSPLVDALARIRLTERRRDVDIEYDPAVLLGTLVAVQDNAIEAGMEKIQPKSQSGE